MLSFFLHHISLYPLDVLFPWIVIWFFLSLYSVSCWSDFLCYILILCSLSWLSDQTAILSGLEAEFFAGTKSHLGIYLGCYLFMFELLNLFHPVAWNRRRTYFAWCLLFFTLTTHLLQTDLNKNNALCKVKSETDRLQPFCIKRVRFFLWLVITVLPTELKVTRLDHFGCPRYLEPCIPVADPQFNLPNPVYTEAYWLWILRDSPCRIPTRGLSCQIRLSLRIKDLLGEVSSGCFG